MGNVTPLFPGGELSEDPASAYELDLEGARMSCLACGGKLVGSATYERYLVCPRCRFHYTVSSRHRVTMLADADTFRETSRWIRSLDPLSFSARVRYRTRLIRDQDRTGLTEAVITGTCTIGGTPAVLIVLDFGFLGGSMGLVVGEKVALALELAARRRFPAVAVINSGGARIQEGVLSLMQMAKTSVAVNEMRRRGVPLVSVLGDPATGQVYASFGSQADLIFAEPGAHVGFAPYSAVQDASERKLAAQQHTAEVHYQHGMLDGVVDREQLKHVISTVFELLRPDFRLAARRRARLSRPRPRRLEAWQMVQLARHPDRPTARHYIDQVFANLVELHGDRQYADAPHVIAGIARLAGQSVVVIGQDRHAPAEAAGGSETEGRAGGFEPGAITPEGFAKARRAMAFAERFRLPIVTLVDTRGPALDLEAWQRGQGQAISSTISTFLNTQTPTISVLIGEGGSEAALAFAVTDRVLMLQNAIYTPISPERGAQTETSGAQEVARALRLTSVDCRRMGIIDAIVREPEGGAHANPLEAARLLKRALMWELTDLVGKHHPTLVRRRHRKYRSVGEYGSPFRSALRRELRVWRRALTASVRALRERPARTSDSDGSAAVENADEATPAP